MTFPIPFKWLSIAALSATLLAGLLGFVAPAAAQAAPSPMPVTVSGTLNVPEAAWDKLTISFALHYQVSTPLDGGSTESAPGYQSFVAGDPELTVEWESGDYAIATTLPAHVAAEYVRFDISLAYRNGNSFAYFTHPLDLTSGSASGLVDEVTEMGGRITLGNHRCELDFGTPRMAWATAVAVRVDDPETSYPFDPGAGQRPFEPRQGCGDSRVYFSQAKAPAGQYAVRMIDDRGRTFYYNGTESGSTSLSGATKVAVREFETSTWTQYVAGTASYAPSISGTVAVGRTVSARVGSWAAGGTLSYQWQRNGVDIPKATRSSYTLTTSDLKRKISVVVVAKKSGHPWITKSSLSKTTALGVLASATPKVRGTAKVGKTVKLSRGTWTSGTRFTYRWYRDGRAISGATGTSYKLRTSDAGKRITVKVSGTKTGYTTKSRVSAKTAKVAKR